MDKDLINKKLVENNMSKEKLAVELGCSIATVYNMLAGKNVRPEYAYRTKKVLGITDADFKLPTGA